VLPRSEDEESALAAGLEILVARLAELGKPPRGEEDVEMAGETRMAP
jgi:hypothetical protein